MPLSPYLSANPTPSSVAFVVVDRWGVRPVRRWWLRQSALRQLSQLAELGDGVTVNGAVRFGSPATTHLGDDVSINDGLVTVGSGSLVIGSHVHFGEGIRILTENHHFRDAEALPYDAVRVPGDVVIGDGVWIGSWSTIMPGVTIGDGAIIGGASVVTRDVEDCTIVGGAPSRPIGSRDPEHFRRLTSEGSWIGWPRDLDVVIGRHMQAPRKARW